MYGLNSHEVSGATNLTVLLVGGRGSALPSVTSWQVVLGDRIGHGGEQLVVADVGASVRVFLERSSLGGRVLLPLPW
jgi:hypothetical protein